MSDALAWPTLNSAGGRRHREDALSSLIDHARALAARGSAESVRRLGELVRIPSLTGEEGEAQVLVRHCLTELGADVRMHEPDIEQLFARFPEIAQYPTHWKHDLVLPYEVLPTYDALRDSGLQSALNYDGRPNVVGILEGSGGGRSLILNGHVDTVTVEPEGEWTKNPFGAEIEDDRMYGRGTSDMKGGVMAGIMALAFLARAGVRLRGDVIFQCVVNEEHAGNGTLDLVRRGYRADAAIVLEPTHNRVAVSHTGGLYWQVTIPGRQRSPGARWKDGDLDGVSAIEKLPGVIQALLDLERGCNQRGAGTEAGGRAPFSLVIGKVSGGTYETATAQEAVLRGSAYFAPDVGSVTDVMGGFRSSIARANGGDPYLSENGARLEFLHHDDSVEQSPDIEIAAAMCGLLAESGDDARIHPGPFCCDMRHLVNQGAIPSIIFGPGAIAQAHKADEHIALGDYLQCIDRLIAFIPRWCGVEGETDPAAAERSTRGTLV